MLPEGNPKEHLISTTHQVLWILLIDPHENVKSDFFYTVSKKKQIQFYFEKLKVTLFVSFVSTSVTVIQ